MEALLMGFPDFDPAVWLDTWVAMGVAGMRFASSASRGAAKKAAEVNVQMTFFMIFLLNNFGG